VELIQIHHNFFFITCNSNLNHSNNINVVFGKIINGLNIIHAIENLPVNSKYRPKYPVIISECGDLRIYQQIELKIKKQILNEMDENNLIDFDYEHEHEDNNNHEQLIEQLFNQNEPKKKEKEQDGQEEEE